MSQEYYQSSFSGEQIDEGIGRIISGELDELVEEAQSALSGVHEAIENIPAGSTPIVNDLTTGGVSMALSAEQGKVLKQNFDAHVDAHPATKRMRLLDGNRKTTSGIGWKRIATMSGADSGLFHVGNKYDSGGSVDLLFYASARGGDGSAIVVLNNRTTHPSANVIDGVRITHNGSLYAVDIHYARSGSNVMSATCLALNYTVEGTSIAMQEWLPVADATDGESLFAEVTLEFTASGHVLTDGSHGMELLWENASPSDFAAQTVSVDLQDCDLAIVVFSIYHSSFQRMLTMVAPKGLRNQNTCWVYGYTYERYYDVISSGIVFANCYKYSSYTKAETTQDNGKLIPVKIYGIKGVS